MRAVRHPMAGDWFRICRILTASAKRLAPGGQRDDLRPFSDNYARGRARASWGFTVSSGAAPIAEVPEAIAILPLWLVC